jgi:hypothetical protein
VATLQTRAINIIRTPATEWPVIAGESTNVARLYTEYIAPLAAIPVVAGFIGLTLMGATVPGVSVRRFGLTSGFSYMVVQYLFSLVAVYVAAVVIEWLAPKFKSSGSRIDALKLVAYSCTAAWLAGIFAIVPLLGILVLVGLIYAFYLFYLGLPHLMKTPADQVVIYMVASAVVIIVINFVLQSIASSLTIGRLVVTS